MIREVEGDGGYSKAGGRSTKADDGGVDRTDEWTAGTLRAGGSEKPWPGPVSSSSSSSLVYVDSSPVHMRQPARLTIVPQTSADLFQQRLHRLRVVNEDEVPKPTGNSKPTFEIEGVDESASSSGKSNEELVVVQQFKGPSFVLGQTDVVENQDSPPGPSSGRTIEGNFTVVRHREKREQVSGSSCVEEGKGGWCGQVRRHLQYMLVESGGINVRQRLHCMEESDKRGYNAGGGLFLNSEARRGKRSLRSGSRAAA
ncbi:hypothetical protein GALMADRAFT_148876 [Galerina marginata CBS 339.88]|uniref:Uncharacterized protein n=1 Tax=Galerina marginata (strain CBS 339.88) TaxID=685588 RepID=A0A067SEK9_GALM3|nr:hypothetical protein GALMADRAFT_148876 [Galerina marginata CBS 339.88]